MKRKFGVKCSTLEQARKGSVNEDHFANNQKCARNVKNYMNIKHGTASHRIIRHRHSPSLMRSSTVSPMASASHSR